MLAFVSMYCVISDSVALVLQRLLKMTDGLNFKDFVAFLSAFSAKATVQQKIEGKYRASA